MTTKKSLIQTLIVIALLIGALTLLELFGAIKYVYLGVYFGENFTTLFLTALFFIALFVFYLIFILVRLVQLRLIHLPRQSTTCSIGKTMAGILAIRSTSRQSCTMKRMKSHEIQVLARRSG